MQNISGRKNTSSEVLGDNPRKMASVHLQSVRCPCGTHTLWTIGQFSVAVKFLGLGGGLQCMYVRLIGREFVIPLDCPQYCPQFWPVSRVENSQEPTTSTGRETPLVDLCKSTDPLHWSLIIGQTLLLEGIMRPDPYMSVVYFNLQRRDAIVCVFQ